MTREEEWKKVKDKSMNLLSFVFIALLVYSVGVAMFTAFYSHIYLPRQKEEIYLILQNAVQDASLNSIFVPLHEKEYTFRKSKTYESWNDYELLGNGEETKKIFIKVLEQKGWKFETREERPFPYYDPDFTLIKGKVRVHGLISYKKDKQGRVITPTEDGRLVVGFYYRDGWFEE